MLLRVESRSFPWRFLLPLWTVSAMVQLSESIIGIENLCEENECKKNDGVTVKEYLDRYAVPVC